MTIKQVPGVAPDAFQTVCFETMDWLGGLEMPEDSVGIREAGGCLGGILVSLGTEGKAAFIAAESGNVTRLCGYLVKEADSSDRAALLIAIRDTAKDAAEAGIDLDITFEAVG